MFSAAWGDLGCHLVEGGVGASLNHAYARGQCVGGGAGASLDVDDITRDFINELCGIDGQGKEEELKEEKPPLSQTNVCLGSSSDVVLNWIPDVDVSDEDTEDDMLDLVDSSESEVEDDGYLGDFGGKVIVDDEGRRAHRVICSSWTVRANYECGSRGRRQTCCSETFVPCCDDDFDEDIIHLVHPGNAGCDVFFILS